MIDLGQTLPPPPPEPLPKVPTPEERRECQCKERRLPPIYSPANAYRNLPKIVHIVLSLVFFDLARILYMPPCTFCIGRSYSYFATLGTESEFGSWCFLVACIGLAGAFIEHRLFRLCSITALAASLLFTMIGFHVGAPSSTAEASYGPLLILALIEFNVESRR